MAKRKPELDPQPAPAEYTVVARRYRPRQFDELIGQEAPAQALMNALTNGRVAHAYLFTGARGVGKTSTARILAKALNCVSGPTPRPCDACEICTSIATGEDIDVLEIDGASNRGIDEVREIRANVGFRPQRARYKIYIIDEVHMLTTPAFNALLKTLEEPPPGVKFIFATTEVNKVPITILSRCQRFDFGTIRTDRIAEHLRSIVSREGKPVDDDALAIIARRAAGSMRDGESLLDQLMAFGEPVTPDLVHRLLGTAAADQVVAIASAVFSGDAREAMRLLSESLAAGSQAGELLDQLVELWRDLMIASSCGGPGPATSFPAKDVERLSAVRSLDVILAGLDILAAAKSRLKLTGYGPLLLEMAIVRLARLDHLMSVGDVWAQLQGSSSPPAATRSVPAASRPSPAAIDSEKKKPLNHNRPAFR